MKYTWMKRIYLLTTLFFAIILSSTAQMNGGIKAGLNVGDIIISNKTDYFGDASFESRASFHVGTYIQKSFRPNIAWQVEMQFSNKGYYLNTNDSRSAMSLNYINWPVLIIYKPNPKLDLETGLEFGLLISGDELFNTFDLGIDIGVNYDISKKINAGLRYNYGLPFKMNIDENDSGSGVPQYQNSVFQVYIGYNLFNE